MARWWFPSLFVIERTRATSPITAAVFSQPLATWMPGTAVEITAIRSVDRIQIGAGKAGPITESLQNAFYGLFSGKTADKWGWLDYVDMSAPRVAASG